MDDSMLYLTYRLIAVFESKYMLTTVWPDGIPLRSVKRGVCE